MADAEATYYFSNETGLQDFLEAEVPQTAAKKISLIEWRPSLDFYREKYVKLLSQLVDFLKRLDATERTVSVFGRRWFKNFFRNLSLLQKTLLYKTMALPIIITGSGPGLEKDLPLIRKVQEDCLIIAASSSLMALASGGVKADLIIATDGGSWALRHIYPCFRKSSDKTGSDCKARLGFTVNLCAALPSQCEGSPFLLINDGSFWQSLVFHALSLPSVIVPQRGTVAASAVDLAIALSSSAESGAAKGGHAESGNTCNIYLAGTDFSVKDIRTHARPYAFDRLLFDKASRFSPVYSQSFLRSGLLEKGGSLDIYSAWFKKQLSSWPKRVFFLESEHEEELCRKTAGKKGGDSKEKYFKTNSVGGDSARFRKRGKEALFAALEDRCFGENLRAELSPLLFPGEKEAASRQIKEKIIGILRDE